MKHITYRILVQHGVPGIAGYHFQKVYAQNINKGMKKALNLFEQDIPKDWELVSIEFWEVLS